MYKVRALYPQYQYSQDRRQQNIPVAYDRRSGGDRRNQDRVQLDTQLTRDIFEVKGKIKDITGTISFNSDQNNIKNITNTNAVNSMQADQFIKSQNAVQTNQEAATKSESSNNNFQTGILALALAGVLFTPFIGPVGLVIAASATVYVGAKVLKEAVSHQVKDDKKDDSK